MVAIKKPWNRLLSLPCMVNSSLSEGGHVDVESCSGIILLSVEKSDLHVITVANKHTYERARECKDRDIKVEVLFKVFGELVTLSATHTFHWKSSDFEAQLTKIFRPKHQWKISYEKDGSKNANDFLLSSFALHRIDGRSVYTQIYEDLINEAFPVSLDHPRHGADVTTISYPFGPDSLEIFTGAVSSGIVGNVCEAGDGSLFMIDARCLPGSEGGGVYSVEGTSSAVHTIGMIVSPLCWKSHELIGMSICCSMRHILYSLLQCSPSSLYKELNFLKQTAINPSTQTGAIPHTPITTVRIEINEIWGSGTICGAIVHSGTCQLVICTCRHVIERKLTSTDLKVCVEIDDIRQRYEGTVLFAANENSVYDLAFLMVSAHAEDVRQILNRMRKRHARHGDDIYEIKAAEAVKGMSVYSKGYGLFDPGFSVNPVLSKGTISNVVQHGGRSVLIHSTCLVHKGSSGGALTCQKSDSLLGITVNHVKDEEANIAYPDVNFSIPCSIFMPAVKRYLFTRDLTTFQSLNLYHEEVVRIWTLKPASSGTAFIKRFQSKL